MNFEYMGNEMVVCPSFEGHSSMGVLKSQLYGSRAAARNTLTARIQRWNEFIALLSPAAISYWAALLQVDRADQFATSIRGAWSATTNKAVLEAQIAEINNLSAALLDRENPIFFHFGVDPIGFTDEQRRLILTLQIVQLMNTEAQGSKLPGKDDEPPYVVNEQGNLVPNTDFKGAWGGGPPKLPDVDKTPTETALEYLPFVGVGLGIFRVFFS